MTSLHVICGLGPPPQSKILATPMGGHSDYSNVSQTGVWGRNPQPPEAMREKSPAAGRFFVILWKQILFIGIGFHFAPPQRNLKVLDFSHFKAN